jgi:protein gp37
MSDLFHPEVPDEFIEGCFNVMNQADWHQFQVLTKRPERALEIAEKVTWGPNIWMGVSVESQPFTKRVAVLKQIPARVRFLSCEPLIGPLKLQLAGIHWVIVGGESGPGSRPMKTQWVRSIRSQCRATNTAFFFKQWGGIRKKETGRVLDGRTWDAFPQASLATS